MNLFPDERMAEITIALNFKLSNIAQFNTEFYVCGIAFLLSAASLLLMILKCLVAIKFYVQLCIFAQIVCFC